MQRKMVGILLKIRIQEGEEPGAFVRRRAREAAIAVRGREWSRRHCERVRSWDAHLRRERNANAWAPRLLKWRDASWLHQQRAQAGSAAATAGRLGTRVSPGRPAQRWEEGVEFANSVL